MADVALAALEASHLVRVNVEAENWKAPFDERTSQRQTHVPQADDAYPGFARRNTG
jgi:hypothetical protein